MATQREVRLLVRKCKWQAVMYAQSFMECMAHSPANGDNISEMDKALCEIAQVNLDKALAELAALVPIQGENSVESNVNSSTKLDINVAE